MSFFRARKTKDKYHHIKGHLYYIDDSHCYDLTLLFGPGNEPTREDDEALKRLLSDKKYVSYDGNMIVFSNLSWMEHKK